MKKRNFFLLLATVTQVSCPGTLFEEIGSNLSAPIAVAVDPARLRAYVVNSNNDLEFTGATLSILDLTDPASPVLLDSAVNPVSIPNFSSQIYFDPVTLNAFVPNRLSEDAEDDIDSLLRINLDEASPAFGEVDSFSAVQNPFGLSCCDPSGRIYVVGGAGTLNVFDPADLSTSVQISLALTLSTGEAVSGINATEAVLLGTTAFVTDQSGFLYVINTAEVGDTSKNPVDYILLNAGKARGIATDGGSIFVVDGTKGETALRILDPSTLTPVDPDSSAATEVDVSTVQKNTVALEEDPNEVVVFNGKACVTNRGSDTVSVIDIATATSTTIAVGDEPFGLAAFTAGGTDYLYVTNIADDSISVIDLGTNSVVSTFSP